MFTDDELLPLSALQHLLFCERQCALIHVERQWAENRLTVEGRHLHERVHEENGVEVRGRVRVVRGLVLRSLRLGLAGVADVVEFREAEGTVGDAAGTVVSGWPGRWQAAPVEYKRGGPKPGSWDAVQVAAQALCLEEMLGGAVPEGVLFYGRPRRRLAVPVDPSLRATVDAASRRLHALVASGLTPGARYEKKCDNCSLLELCLPRLGGRRRTVRDYLSTAGAND